MFQAFVFQGEIAQVRHELTIHTLDSTQLFYYLLNPSFESFNTDDVDTNIDFLDIQESGTGLLATLDSLKLESIAQAWLEQLYQYSNLPEYHP